MLDVIRATVLAGLGAGVITKEKAEEAVNRLVRQGRLTADEGRQLVKDLLESGSQQWEAVQAGFSETLRKALESADIARAKDLAEVGQRLKQVEQRLAMLEDATEKAQSSGGSSENLSEDPSDNPADNTSDDPSFGHA